MGEGNSMNEFNLFVASIMVFMVGVLWGHFSNRATAPKEGQLIMVLGAILTLITGVIYLW